MLNIEKIEIKYFRSIYNITLKNVQRLTVITGKNDVGKSNIIKALNLFFEGKTDYETLIDFQRDFNKERLNEVKKESVKGKQFISIKITFTPPKNYIKSIPGSFAVTKTWNRESKEPSIKINTEMLVRKYKLDKKKEKTAERSISKLLGRIRFTYVPAVKDRAFQSNILGNLQDLLIESSHTVDLKTAIDNLNDKMTTNIRILQDEFKKATNIQTKINLPEEMRSIFQAFSVNTIDSGIDNIQLIQRGDGIQARFVSSLLYYITTHSNVPHIWGFEEPENSLDYNFAVKLAEEFKNIYSSKAQILCTSHAIPFIQLKGDKITVMRVFKEDLRTKATVINCNNKTSDASLIHVMGEEMGLYEMQKEYYEKYKILMVENEDIKSKLIQINRDCLLVAGETDKLYLQKAAEVFNLRIPRSLLRG